MLDLEKTHRLLLIDRKLSTIEDILTVQRPGERIGQFFAAIAEFADAAERIDFTVRTVLGGRCPQCSDCQRYVGWVPEEEKARKCSDCQALATTPSTIPFRAKKPRRTGA